MEDESEKSEAENTVDFSTEAKAEIEKQETDLEMSFKYE
jgi:hypothetical protein